MTAAVVANAPLIMDNPASAADPRIRHEGLRNMLRIALESGGGLLMSDIPGRQSALDAEIYADIQESGTLRFKEKAGAFLNVPIRYDAVTGRLELVDKLSDNADVRHVRSGTGETLTRDMDPGSEYNRRVIVIAEQILSLGIIEELVIGRPLPGIALLYLKPFPTPEDSTEAFLSDVVEAIQRFKPRGVSDAHQFEARYSKIIRRLVQSGLPLSSMTPGNIQGTIQAEFTRCALRSEVWRKLWRWCADCSTQVTQMRRLPGVYSDGKMVEQVTQIELALKRLASVVAVYVGNATTLYRKAIDGADFYVEAPASIAYVRESSASVDDVFLTVGAWSEIWTNLPKNPSMADMRQRLDPHRLTVKKALSLPIPAIFVI